MEVTRSVAEQAGEIASRFQEARPLAWDLLEGEDEYRLVFDAPGAAASDVQVRFLDGDVVVRIDRFREFRRGYEMVAPGRGMALDGRAELPADAEVDPETAAATLRNDGTLLVEIPKA
ncbi:MAG: Hsp20/alpha crystallin family protein [Halobacteriales archaeon]